MHRSPGRPGDDAVERGLARLVATLRSGEALVESNRLSNGFLGLRVPDRASGFRAPSWIVAAIAIVALMCLAGTAASIAAADYVWLEWAFRYPGALLLICLAGAELRFTMAVRERFAPGEPMRSAWTLLMLAAIAHLAGRIMLAALPGADVPGWIGLAAAGPLRFGLLTAGLAVVVRIALRAGLLPTPTVGDAAVILAAGALAVTQLRQAAGLLSAPVPALLLIEAVLVRRMLLNLGWDRLARCWTALAVGSALATLGSLAASWSATNWFVCFLAGAAFALAPAYQLQAARDTVPLCRSVLQSGDWLGCLGED